MESMSSMLKYKTTYVFPKRIKKVNNEKATFSLDGKTMNIEYGFFDIISNPEIISSEHRCRLYSANGGNKPIMR
jgi:hypothetical protein